MITQRLLSREKSQHFYERSCGVIPSGVNSPVRSFPGLELTPLFAASGFEDKIEDLDGNVFIDFCCSWGALIHGHAHAQILEAVKRRMDLGTTFGLSTPIEAELAQYVVDANPSVEKVRFVSSGTEATMSAVRLARGFTKRDYILKFDGNYHGHADLFLVKAGSGVSHLNSSSSAGIPEQSVKHTLSIAYNDREVCSRVFKEMGSRIAAVIVEPVAANMGLVEPEPGFLEMLREETSRCGALLIFDEVITGFRIAFGGATEYFGINPDLVCLGKIIGGGFPAAAFGGSSEIMEYLAPSGAVYQAGTLSGNPVAMEAGLQAISMCREPRFYQRLKAKTDLLTRPVYELIEKKELNMCLHQVGSLFTLFFGKREVKNLEDVKQCDVKQFNNFFKRMFEQGIYLSPSQFEANFVSAAHTEESLIYTRDCFLEALLA